MLMFPLGENVIISPEKEKETTDEGIFIPESANNDHKKIGEVVAVGDSEKITIKKGQSVLYRRHAPSEYVGMIGKKECILIHISDILAVVEK